MFAVETSPAGVASLLQASPSCVTLSGIRNFPDSSHRFSSTTGTRSSCGRFLGVLFSLLAMVSGAQAGGVSLAWDPNPEPDIAGYRVYYGLVSRSYSNSIDLGNATTCTISNLAKGSTYYIAVTAYNAFGLESTPSAEVSFDSPPNVVPTVQLINPVPGAAYNTPGTIALSADAADSDGLISKVEFYAGSEKIGEAPSAPYRLAWYTTNAGSQTITAVAYDDNGAVGSATASLQTCQLAVTSSRHLPDGTFELTVAGAPGRTNHVLASDDLQTWTEIEVAVNLSGAVTVTDPEASQHRQRFYKVVSD